MRHAIMTGSLVVISVVAVAGWVRKPTGTVAYPVQAAQTAPTGATSALYTQAAPQDQYGQSPAYNSPAPYGENAGVYGPGPAYGQAQAYPQAPAYAQAPAYVPASSYASEVACRPRSGYASRYPRVNRRVVRRQYVPERVYSDRVYVRRPRPFSHSAAIVAGSAGAGAAVGALAGGGKGAGIGALAGGAAGLLYDRLTHNH
jgi:hypothetical protein